MKIKSDPKTYKTIGQKGEDFVVQLISKNGFVVCDRNYRYSRLGEIDIFATFRNCLYSIEVKTLVGNDPLLYQDRINSRKKARIVNLTEIYCREKNLSGIAQIRYYVAFVGIQSIHQDAGGVGHPDHLSNFKCTFIEI